MTIGVCQLREAMITITAATKNLSENNKGYGYIHLPIIRDRPSSYPLPEGLKRDKKNWRKGFRLLSEFFFIKLSKLTSMLTIGYHAKEGF